MLQPVDLTPREVVDSELTVLLKSRDECRASLEIARDRIKIIDAQVDILSKILISFPGCVPPANGYAAILANGMSRPTDAILQLLAENPDGLSTVAIVDRLDGKVASKSKNVRRLIGSMVEQIRQSGRIELVEGTNLNRLASRNGS